MCARANVTTRSGGGCRGCGDRWGFPELLKACCHSLPEKGQDRPLAKAAALTRWAGVLLAFISRLQRPGKQKSGQPAPKGCRFQVLRCPEVPEVEARFGTPSSPTASSALPLYPHPCRCQDQRAWAAVSDAQGPRHKSRVTERSPWDGSQE